MRQIRTFGLVLTTLLIGIGCGSSNSGPRRAPVDLVNPFIGSGGHYYGYGSVFPSATYPFGMAKPGPDTSEENGVTEFHHFSGYHADDTIINGFSQVHISGTGAPDYGALLFMPTLGFDLAKTREMGYRAHFSKQNEKASPGSYAVTFDDPAIQVELTCTARCAYHRYTFPAGSQDATVLIDLSHALPGCQVAQAHLDVGADGAEISGWLLYQGALTGRSGGVKLFFVASLRQPASGWTLWHDTVLVPGALSMDGNEIGAALSVDPAAPVEIRIGLSYVDLDGARNNLAAELPAWDFERTRTKARQTWIEALSKIQVSGGTEAEQTIFYSALYHAQFTPTLFTDADARYTGVDKQIHQADGFTYYSDFSLWDTYRTFHPLMTLIDPARQRDLIRSLLAMYQQEGFLPRWPAGTGEGGSMIGTPADMVISEAFIKGIRDFDADLAYTAILQHATTPQPSGREGLDNYLTLGYVPVEEQSGATAHTLEYGVADGAIANLAAALGKDDDAATFTARAKNYRNVWDPQTQFMRGRKADGTWAESDDAFNPLDWAASYYVEGDAWQYLWLVLQDPEGLRDLFGGAGPMGDKLDAFFATPEPPDDLAQFLPRKYYWPGNEVDIHAATFFDVVGRPDRAQYWMRNVMNTFYGSGPDGLPGNDDCGTMSSWYLFAASGFYPMAGQERYFIGSPLFEKIVFDLGNGKTFTVNAEGASAENLYIQSARLNGKPLAKPEFTHSAIRDGGTLDLSMGSRPSSWGK